MVHTGYEERTGSMGQFDRGMRIDRASDANGANGAHGVYASEGRIGWACHYVKLL